MASVMSLMWMRLVRSVSLAGMLLATSLAGAAAQTAPPAADAPKSATPKAAPSTPQTTSPSATPPSTTTPATPTPATPTVKPPPSPSAPAAKPETTPAPTPETGTPRGKPGNTEIEPHGSPGIPQNATTESVDVPARPAVIVTGQSSYDDAFKSIKASLETLKTSMDKAGLKPSGHAITIFSEPDDKGFRYKVAVPIAAKPNGKPDLGTATIGETPSGKAIKFQHRGAYEDIDSTYDVITAYLDAKGLQAENPYIEEYLNELTTGDDPNLQVDIYVFVKK